MSTQGQATTPPEPALTRKPAPRVKECATVAEQKRAKPTTTAGKITLTAQRIAAFNDPSRIAKKIEDPLELLADGIRARIEAGYSLQAIKTDLAADGVVASLSRIRAFAQAKGWREKKAKGKETQ